MVSKTDEIKLDIEFNSLKEYIRKIKSQLPKLERLLVHQWLKKLKQPHKYRAEYITRMHTEIVRGYLCPPFSTEPPDGDLEPLPPPHTHTNSCCTSLSSIMSQKTSFTSMEKEGGPNDMVFKYSDSESPSSRDTATFNANEHIVRVRSEPNLMKSKFHLSNCNNQKWEQCEGTMGDGVCLKTNGGGGENLDRVKFGRVLEEFNKEKNEEMSRIAENGVGTSEKMVEESAIGIQDNGVEDVDEAVESIKNVKSDSENLIVHRAARVSPTEESIERKFENFVVVEKLVALSRQEKCEKSEVKEESRSDGIKELKEVFLNKKYVSDVTKDSLDTSTSSEKPQNNDLLKKLASIYQARYQDKIIDLENKRKALTLQNAELAEENRQDKAEIENLRQLVETLKRENNDLVEASHQKPIDVKYDTKNETDIPAKKSSEKLSDIIDTLSALLEKSNRHIEKLSSLSIKFNLIKSDYELERKEMILKFKSIDSLHQNILTELVKQRVSEGKEYEDLLENYRTQFQEKNAEIAKLQNTTCDACAERRAKVENESGNQQEEVQKLREQVSHLTQINKELIYSYEKKMKKLMSEKYLEGKLMNTLLKAQKEEIEIYLTGQKHEELRRLAENLESQYSRIVDEEIKAAKSQQETSVSK